MISFTALRTDSKSCKSHSIGTNFPSGTDAFNLSSDSTDRDEERFSNKTSPPCFATVSAAIKPVPDVVPVVCDSRGKKGRDIPVGRN